MNGMKAAFGVLLSCLVLPVCAMESPFGEVATSIGIDAQWRSMPFQKDFGGNVTKNNYPQGAAYAAFKCNDLFGLELGYQKTASVSRGRQYSDAPYTLFGVDQALLLGDSDIINTKSTLKGPYGALVGLFPLSEAYRLKLIGSLGVARLKLRLNARIITAPVPNETLTGFSKYAWVPKIAVGLQHMVNKNIGTRVMLGWEKTSQFNQVVGTDLKTGKANKARVTLKDSTTISAGVFYSF